MIEFAVIMLTLTAFVLALRPAFPEIEVMWWWHPRYWRDWTIQYVPSDRMPFRWRLELGPMTMTKWW